MRKFVIGVFLIAAIGMGAVAAALEFGWFDIPLAELEAKYKQPQSQFADIDGIRVHYMDEGPREAPALVMLHASYNTLRTFDQIAKPLAQKYRVVRFDFPTAGLTGPDPKKRYSIDLNMQILDQLTRQLGIERFALLGTSSGGPVAFRYAAQTPERVSRLILINSAGMPRSAVSNPNRLRGTAIGRWVKNRFQTEADCREDLGKNVTSMAPPEWMIDFCYHFGRREGQREEGAIFMRNFQTGNPEEMLGRVRTPTMIMWGMENPTVMHLEANVMSLWLTNAPSVVVKYPKVGHYMYVEIPDQVATDIAAFLDGEKDGDLRVTKRVAVSEAPL